MSHEASKPLNDLTVSEEAAAYADSIVLSAAMSLEVSPPLPCFGRPPPASGARLLPLAGG